MAVNSTHDSSIIQKTTEFGKEERIVVLIRIGGGNDDLHCRVPWNMEDRYLALRPELRSVRNNSFLLNTANAGFNVADNQTVWVNPDMQAYFRMMQKGWGHTINGVSYGHRTNMSHFASDDIMFSGGWSEAFRSDGWIGRYLANMHPSFPSGYPSDANPYPLALETQGMLSKAMQKDGTLPLGAAIPNPDAYYSDVLGVQGGIIGGIPASLATTPYGKGLDNLSKSLNSNRLYAKRVSEAFNAGISKADYTASYGGKENFLAPQLRTIAKVIKGQHTGADPTKLTRVFLAHHGGFDTHANQINDHPGLMNNWFESIESFLYDLWADGLFNKVIVVCHTEFGRRPKQNGTGTDHGSAHPMHLFGPVSPGITGYNPLIGAMQDETKWGDDVDSIGNIFHQYDYRDILARVLTNWMDAPAAAVAAAKFDNETLTTKVTENDVERIINYWRNPITYHYGLKLDTLPPTA